MQDVVDGTGATILVLQVGVEKAVPWTQPVDVEFDVNAPFAGIGRIPETGLAVLFPDGSSLRISPTTPPDVFKALITPAGKERLSPAQISAAILR